MTRPKPANATYVGISGKATDRIRVIRQCRTHVLVKFVESGRMESVHPDDIRMDAR